jgi:hypothetical protein
MQRTFVLFSLLALSLPASRSLAVDGVSPEGEPASPSPSAPTHSPWVTGAASVMPGLVLHGSGVWLAGDRQTARTLLTAEGIGLGLILAGIAPLIATDASGQNVDLSVTALAAGTGLFLTSWLADLYGAMVGGREARASDWVPWMEAHAGYAYVYDPQFDYRHFSVLRLDGRHGRLRVSPKAWLATDSDTQVLGMDLAARLAGAWPGMKAADGSYVDVQVGATHHRFGDDRFSIFTAEILVPGRLDLRRIGPSLGGSFVDFQLGWAFQFFDYWLPGRGFGTDINALLLMRFGFGVYLGGPENPRGEVQVYYDHRHDGLAGGLALDMHDPQFFGHVGVSGVVHLAAGWGVTLTQEVGSASISSLGLNYRWGGRP